MQELPGPARSTRCQIGGVCFLHLGGGEQEGGKHEHVSHTHIKAMKVALNIQVLNWNNALSVYIFYMLHIESLNTFTEGKYL